MSHPGVSPIDTSTDTGRLRVVVGDTSSTPISAGIADYAVWSDADLEVALAVAGESIYRAAASLYFSLAAQYAQQGKSTKTDDLSLDTRGRSGDLISIAKAFLGQAADEDAQASNDFFQIVPFAGRTQRSIRPEGTPWPLPIQPPTPPEPSGDLDGGSA